MLVGVLAPSAIAAEPAMPRSAAVSFEEAVPGIAPTDVGRTAIYLDSAGREISAAGVPRNARPNTAAEHTAIGCTPESLPDNPHYSNGDVSGHGAWKKGNCSNNLADVFNCLYEWYTDNTWRQKACSPTKRLKPYTGSGQRTVARAPCDSRALTSWRNHIDVDVVDETDTGENPYRQRDDVDCRVF